MANIKHLLDKIRKAIYGKEVRGSLADGLEAVNNEVEDATEVAVNVEHRQDAVEQQFNTLLGEWSDDKPIDNAETIAARTNTKESKTYENLGKRLDEEYGKVTEQLADTADNMNTRAVNVMFPPAPLIGAKADGTDQTNVIQNIINGRSPHDTFFIPKDIIFDITKLIFPDNISLEYFERSKNTFEKVSLIHHVHPNGTPVNEYEYVSPYHLGLVLSSRSDLNADVTETSTTLARSIVFRKDGKTQLIETVYGDGRYRVRHVDTYNDDPFGNTVYEIQKDTSDVIFSKPIRMSTIENAVPANNLAVSRMIAGYSDYQNKRYYIDYNNGSDSPESDGSLGKPYKTFEYMAYEALPYLNYGDLLVVFLSDYPEDIELRGLINLNENRLSFRTRNLSDGKVLIGGNVDFKGIMNVQFQNLHFYKDVSFTNSNGVLLDGCISSGDGGVYFNGSNGRVKGTEFRGNIHGIRAINDSYVVSQDNTGSVIDRALSATQGAIIRVIGTQPNGEQLSGLDSSIIPQNQGKFVSQDNKTVTYKNGLIVGVE